MSVLRKILPVALVPVVVTGVGYALSFKEEDRTRLPFWKGVTSSPTDSLHPRSIQSAFPSFSITTLFSRLIDVYVPKPSAELVALVRVKLDPVSQAMKSNEQVILAVVQQNGCALEYASEDLRNNEKIVLAAVQQRAYALEAERPCSILWGLA